MPESISFICCFHKLTIEAEKQLSDLRNMIEETNITGEIVLVSTDKPNDQMQRCIDQYIMDNGRGIYYAMNIGLKAARNNFVNFNNLGDKLLFIPEIFADVDLVSFSARIFTDEGVEKFIRLPNFKNRRMPCHQAIFTKTTRHRLFNLNYKYAADLDFYLNFKGVKSYSEQIICEFHLGGVSNSKLTLIRRKLERCDILLRKYLKFRIW